VKVSERRERTQVLKPGAPRSDATVLERFLVTCAHASPVTFHYCKPDAPGFGGSPITSCRGDLVQGSSQGRHFNKLDVFMHSSISVITTGKIGERRTRRGRDLEWKRKGGKEAREEEEGLDTGMTLGTGKGKEVEE